MKRLGLLIVLILLLGSALARGDQTVRFETVWSMVRTNSPGIAASDYEDKEARVAYERARRHWYPRVYATAKAYATNDPATSFMSNLGQRETRATDFAPASLNHPGNHVYEQGSIGIDLPLYEGGAKVAQARASRKLSEAKSWERKGTVVEHYSRLASEYASLLVYRAQRDRLGSLKGAVTEILGNYKIGDKANPIGYSGLLGLRSLANRIDGLLTESAAALEGHRNSIQIQARDLPSGWGPARESFRSFIARVFPLKASSSNASPAPVQAAQKNAEAIQHTKAAERARFLPQAGVFAQGDLYAGGRGGSESYTSGAYLQWELSATNVGALAQAEHAAGAARARAEELRERFDRDRASGQTTTRAIERGLSLMDQNMRLLEEQTQVARELFLNGSINALQLVETLSRRVDLITARAEAELGLIAARSAVFIANGGAEVVDGD